jgi:uncharacterized protein YjbI with pentapeptide repeats
MTTKWQVDGSLVFLLGEDGCNRLSATVSHYTNSGGTSEEACAVAQTFAASNDMLEALEKLVACIDETRGANAQEALVFARAAIKKARGDKLVLPGESRKGADLRSVYLEGADLRSVDFTDANLRFADLMYANLAGAKLYKANLARADLTGADLRRTDLEGADLARADLTGANLYGAYLRGAKLIGANLEGANLEGAVLEGVRYNGKTVWPEGFQPPPSAVLANGEKP